MEIVITHEEAIKQHPEIANKWIKEAKEGKSSLDPTALKWSYDFGVRVQGMRGNDFIRKLGSGELLQENKKQAERTPEQVADETISNVIGLSLKVTGIGFKREKGLTEPPQLFIEKYRTMIIEAENKKAKERERFESLTPEEKEREEQELLGELFDMGGFYGFQAGPGGLRPMKPVPKVKYEIDDILDKVSRVGVDGLSPGEKRFLDEHSKKM